MGPGGKRRMTSGSNDDAPQYRQQYNEPVKRTVESTRLQFNGDLFERHTIPVELYGPALIHYGRVFNRVHMLAAPKAPRVSVEIQAEVGGSFIADLLINVPDLWDAAKALLTSQEVDAVLKGKELALLVGGAFAWITFHHRAKGKVSQTTIPDGSVRCEDSDGNILIVPGNVPELVQDRTVRREMDAFTQPLDDDGVDSIDIELSSETVEIKDSDRPAFVYESDLVEDEEVLVTEEVVWPVGTSFAPDVAWTFDNSEKKRFRAKMRDERFLDAVRSGDEHIRQGDRMKVRMHTTVFRDSRRPVREIVLVHSHQSNEDDPLPFEF